MENYFHLELSSIRGVFNPFLETIYNLAPAMSTGKTSIIYLYITFKIYFFLLFLKLLHDKFIEVEVTSETEDSLNGMSASDKNT